jgi:hypothetical protein
MDSFSNRKMELEVLSDFYYNLGGKEVIPEKVAKKRLGKERYRAGKYAIKEELYDEACSLLKCSFKDYPNIKTLLQLIRAILKL